MVLAIRGCEGVGAGETWGVWVPVTFGLAIGEGVGVEGGVAPGIARGCALRSRWGPAETPDAVVLMWLSASTKINASRFDIERLPIMIQIYLPSAGWRQLLRL